MGNEFKQELETLLNKYSIDNYCEAPDFIVMEHLVNAIENLAKTTNANISWHSSWKTLEEELASPQIDKGQNNG